LNWGLAVGVGIALTVAAGVWALLPEVDGLSQSQVRASMTRVRTVPDPQRAARLYRGR
jgi:uncharacterized membrane protein